MTSGRETENGERELIRQPSCYDCSSRLGVEEEPGNGSGVEEEWEGYIRERGQPRGDSQFRSPEWHAVGLDFILGE